MSLYSPTKLDAFDPGPEGCIRQGAFKYWGDKYGYPREPKGDNAKLGIELHKCGEDYQNEGKRPDRLTLAGELFIEGIPYLPAPKTSQAEGEKQLDVAGHSYGMFVDLMGVPPRAPVSSLHVVDYKSSSNPTAYGLWQKRSSGEGYAHRKGFLDDIQAVLCASWQVVHTGDAQADLMWLYFGFKQTKRKDPLTGATLVTRGPPFKAKPSYVTLERGELEEAFGRLVHPRAELVASLESVKADPLTLDFNPRHCHKYNRDCFYVPICNLKPEEQVFGIRSKTKPTPVQKVQAPMGISLADRIEAKRAGLKTASTEAQTVADSTVRPPPPPPPPPPAAKEDKINPAESRAVTAQPSLEKAQQLAARKADDESHGAVMRAGRAALDAPPFSPTRSELYAVFAQRIGEAMIEIAKDLRK